MYLKRLFDGSGQIRGVRVVRGRTRQHFSPRFIMRGVDQGWLSIKGDTIVLDGDTPTVYRIVREPGRYPDPNSHSGYQVAQWYECERLAPAMSRPSLISRTAFLRGATLIGNATTTKHSPTWNAGTSAVASPAGGRV